MPTLPHTETEIKEKLGFFCEGTKDEVEDTDYRRQDEHGIDSTEDEGNDDDTRGTGGKRKYIYKCCNNKWVGNENQQAL